MAKLSAVTIKKHNPDEFVLYTDCPEYFYDFPYDNIITTNFFSWKWDRRYWNIPKLHTYSLQTKPFVHIDLDIVLTRSFRIDYSNDFITELIRPIESTESPYRHLPRELSKGLVLCSGIYGCTNDKAIPIFRELYSKAKAECADGQNESVDFNDLFSLEEHWMYKRVVDDAKLSLFQVNPYMFMHFGGSNKPDKYSNVVDTLCKRYKVTL
jgi:hypothetical protein